MNQDHVSAYHMATRHPCVVHYCFIVEASGRRADRDKPSSTKIYQKGSRNGCLTRPTNVYVELSDLGAGCGRVERDSFVLPACSRDRTITVTTTRENFLHGHQDKQLSTAATTVMNDVVKAAII